MQPSMAMSGAPPLPPDVLEQQMPLGQRFGGGGGGGSAPGVTAQPDPNEYAKAKMAEIASALSEVVQILSQTKPALMPILQKIAQAGAMVMSELETQGSTPEASGEPALARPQAEGPGQMGM